MLHTDAAMLGAAPVVVPPPIRRSRSRVGRANESERDVDRQELRRPRRELRAQEPPLGFRDGPARRAAGEAARSARRAVVSRDRRVLRERAPASPTRCQHFDRARAVVPDDPHVLFGEACLQETLGAPRIQNFVRVTTLPNGLSIRGVDAGGQTLAARRRRCCAARSRSIHRSSRRGCGSDAC